MKKTTRVISLLLIVCMLISGVGTALAGNVESDEALPGSMRMNVTAVDSIVENLYKATLSAKTNTGVVQASFVLIADTSVVQFVRHNNSNDVTISENSTVVTPIKVNPDTEADEDGAAYTLAGAEWSINEAQKKAACVFVVYATPNADNMITDERELCSVYFRVPDITKAYKGCIGLATTAGADFTIAKDDFSYINQGGGNVSNRYMFTTDPLTNKVDYSSAYPATWPEKLVSLSVTASPDAINVPTLKETARTSVFTVTGKYLSGSDATNPGVTWTAEYKTDGDYGATPMTGVSFDAATHTLTVNPCAAGGTVKVTATSTQDTSVKASKELVITRAEAMLTTVTAIVSPTTVPVPRTGDDVVEMMLSFDAEDQYGDHDPYPTSAVYSVCDSTGADAATPTGVSIVEDRIKVTKDAAANTFTSDKYEFYIKADALGVNSDPVKVTLTRETAALAAFEIQASANTVAVPKAAATGNNELELSVKSNTAVDQYGVSASVGTVAYKLCDADGADKAYTGVSINANNKLVVDKTAIDNTFNANNMTLYVKGTSGSVSSDVVEITLTRETSSVETLGLYRTGSEAITTDTLIIPLSDSESYSYTVKVVDQYGKEMDNAVTWSTTSSTLPTGVSRLEGTITVDSTASEAENAIVLKAVRDGKSAQVTISLAKIQVAWPVVDSAAAPKIAFKAAPVYGDTYADIVTTLSATGTASTGGSTSYTGKFSVENGTVKPDAGTTTVTIKFTVDDIEANGVYKNATFTKEYTIPTVARIDVTNDLLNYDLTAKTYNGAAQPIAEVTAKTAGTFDSNAITVKYYKGADEVVGGPVDAGSYTVKAFIDQSTNYNAIPASGLELGTYTINQKPLSEVTIAEIPAKSYDTMEWRPEPAVSFDRSGTTVTLEKTDDFTYSYADNIKAGSAAKVTITAVENGNYSGSKTVNFTINKAALIDSTTGASPVYTGSPVEIHYEEFYYNGRTSVADGTIKQRTLKVSDPEFAQEFTFVYPNGHTDAGRTLCKLTPTATSNFTPGSVGTDLYFEIQQKEITAITFPAITKTYDGDTIVEAVSKSDITLTGVVTGDDLYITYTFGEYASANVGAAYEITVSGIALDGADKGNYKFADGVGANKTLTGCAITPADVGGTLAITFAANGDVENDGTYNVGDTVKADNSGVTPAVAQTGMTYKWYRVVSESENLELGTGETYIIATDDLNSNIFVVGTPVTGGNYTGTVKAESIQVGKAPFLGTITLSTDAETGEDPTTGNIVTATIDITNGTATADDYTIAWYRNGTVITGATAATYTLTNDDLGKEIKCVITATATGDYTGTKESDVLAIPAGPVGAPVITITYVSHNAATVEFSSALNGNNTVTYVAELYSADGTFIKTGTVANGVCTFPALTAGTSYAVKVTAAGDVNTTEVSSISTFTTDTEKPSSEVVIYTATGSISDETLINALNNLDLHGTVRIISEKETVTLTGKQLRLINVKHANITTSTPAGFVTLSYPALDEMRNADDDVVKITMAVVKKADDNAKVNALIADGNTAYKVLVTVNGKEYGQLQGKATIGVPAETGKTYFAHFKTNGNVEYLAGTMKNGYLTAETFEFCYFVVMAEKDVPQLMTFTDVAASDWFYKYVKYAFENGIMDGVGNNRFDPNGTTNRAMMATVLYRLAGSPDVSGYGVDITKVFTDVKAGEWYTNAIVWAYKNGIVEGYGDGTFGTTNKITRQEMVTMLYRYAKLAKADLSKGETTSITMFTDDDKVADWALKAMRWAVGNGIVDGMDNALVPEGNATRAQLATVLQRFIVDCL